MNNNQLLLEQLEREDLRVAPFMKRFAAYMIDTFIIVFLTMAILYSRFGQAKNEIDVLNIINSFAWGLLLLQFIYHSLFCYLYGASLGKMALKIMIIDSTTMDKPGLIKSCVRAGVRQLSDSFFCLGFAWALSNPLLKTWHDYAAKTVVIDLA